MKELSFPFSKVQGRTIYGVSDPSSVTSLDTLVASTNSDFATRCRALFTSTLRFPSVIESSAMDGGVYTVFVRLQNIETNDVLRALLCELKRNSGLLLDVQEEMRVLPPREGAVPTEQLV